MGRSILSIKLDYKTNGAQQSDQNSASSIYRKLGFEVTECFVDLITRQVRFYPEKDLQKLRIYDKLTFLIKYFFYLIINLDGSQREFYTLDNFYKISIFTKSLDHPIVIAENSDLTFLTLVAKCCRYTRSVNFAPIHIYKEMGITKATIRFLPKLTSVIFERICNNILSISVDDCNLYKKIPSNKKIEVLPLRNLLLHQKIPLNSIDFESIKPNFTLLASTYNVGHNLQNLHFFHGAISSLQIDNIKFNIYGAKLPNLKFDESVVNIKGWAKDVHQIFDENDLFVAMFGGTGQMMKIYEPFSKGKLLIANPDLFKNSQFLPNVHFLPARTPYQFISQIAYAINNSFDVKKFRIRGFELYSQLFKLEAQLKKLSLFFNDHS